MFFISFLKFVPNYLDCMIFHQRMYFHLHSVLKARMLTDGDENLQEIGECDRHLFSNHFSAERLRLPFYPKFFFLLYSLVQQKFKRLKLMQHMEEPFPSWSKLVVLVETFRKVGNSENLIKRNRA